MGSIKYELKIIIDDYNFFRIPSEEIFGIDYFIFSWLEHIIGKRSL